MMERIKSRLLPWYIARAGAICELTDHFFTTFKESEEKAWANLLAEKETCNVVQWVANCYPSNLLGKKYPDHINPRNADKWDDVVEIVTYAQELMNEWNPAAYVEELKGAEADRG